MPITRSAKRELRKSPVRRRRNDLRRSAIRFWRRKVQKHREAGEVEDAKKTFPHLQKAVDKAAARGVIHPNRAARIKARLGKPFKGS